jgi:hypothetical protein
MLLLPVRAGKEIIIYVCITIGGVHKKCWLEGLTDRGNLRDAEIGRRIMIN